MELVSRVFSSVYLAIIYGKYLNDVCLDWLMCKVGRLLPYFRLVMLLNGTICIEHLPQMGFSVSLGISGY